MNAGSTYTSDRFLRACRGQPVDITPVWIMRQAGRYLPEYREVRARASFADLLRTPELAAEVTLQPVRRFALDAAIIFSDILVVTEAMGVPFEIVSGRGPVLERTVGSRADVDGLRVPTTGDFAHLTSAIGLVVRELGGRIPLIGFAGAPYTLACYVVEGGPSKTFASLRRLCSEAPEVADALLDRLSEAVAVALKAQIRAGAAAVQLFDTWAGTLGPTEFARFALRPARSVLEALAECGVPRILYVGHTGHYLERLANAPADVIGVDWRTPLSEARAALGSDKALQGNLDPCALFLPQSALQTRVAEVLAEGRGAGGHIFNLGHGVLPETDPDQVGFLVDAVHRLSAG